MKSDSVLVNETRKLCN